MIIWVIILGFVARLISLNQSLWLDEATTANAASRFGFWEIITKFSPGDFHPPLYYLVIKAWSLIFGTSEIVLRLPSVIFGVATIYVVYLIAKEINFKLKITHEMMQSNYKLPEVVAILLATSGLHIYYSQEARMYSLSALLISYLVYLFVKKRWVLFSPVLLLIGLTDYPALLIIPVFWIFGRKIWKQLAICHIPLVVCFLAWLPILFKQLSVGLSTVGSSWGNLLGAFSLKNFVLILVKFILGRISFDNKYLYVSIIVIAAFFFGYLILKSTLKSTRRVNFLIWLWFLLPILLGFVISLKLPIFSYFRFLFCLPAFYLLVACGISTLKKPWFYLFLGFALITNLLTSSYYLFLPKFHRENWRGLVGFVEGQKTDKSITLFVADANMEAYRYYAPDAHIAGPETFGADYDQIWLMRYLQPVFDSNDLLRAKIEASGYNKDKEHDFNGVVVWEYRK